MVRFGIVGRLRLLLEVKVRVNGNKFGVLFFFVKFKGVLKRDR